MLFNKNNAVQKNWRMVKKGKQIVFGCTLFFAGGLALAAPAQASDQTAKAEATAVVAADNSASQGDTTSKEVESTQPKVESKETATPKETSATEKAVVSEKVVVDKSKLESILLQAKELKLVGKSSEAVAELEKAIKEAELLLTKENVTQEEINSGVADLTKVLDKVKAEKATSAIDKKSAEGEKASTSNKEATSEVATPTAKKEAVLESRTEPTAVSETTTQSGAVPTTSSSNPSDENTTASVVNEKPTTTRVRSRRALSEGNVRSVDENNLQRAVVTKENFESFFQEGGTASYDESTGIIRLTEDKNSQAGNAYLRFKIDSEEDFTFTGKVDIGDKYEGNGSGGDGVGFVFHTGKVDKLGQTGASVGMGQIPAAFGFKLDTYHNTSTPNAANNSIADPKYGGLAYKSNAFGAFYSSNNAGRVNTIGDAKALSPAPSGQLVDFKISYSGSTKDFTVTYGGQTWSTNIATAKAGNNTAVITQDAKNALNKSKATYALSFVASTGGATNLQRVQIERFEFTAPQIVHVKYVDEQGNELASNTAVPGDENQVVNLNNINSLQKTINALKAKGYTLKDTNKEKAETYNAGANTVTLRKGGQLLKYVFAVPTPEVTKTLPSDGGMLPNGGIKSTDRTLSGTGTPGATINIKVAGNTVVDNVTVESNGKWTATLPTGLNSNVTTQDQLVPKNSLVVTQKIGVSESEAAAVDVALGESSVVPSTESKDQQSIVAETTTVTLKVPHDAGISYFDYPKTGGRSEVAIKRDSIPGAWVSKDASKAVVKSYSSDGFVDTIVLEMKEQIQPGKAKVISNIIKETKYSSPTGWKEIKVEEKPDTTPPAAPAVNSVKVGATSLTGTAEANSKVEATLQNGSKVTATAGADGSFTIPVSGLNEGDTISVTATDAAGNKSTPSVVTVKEAVRPVVNIPYDDKANQIIYVYSGEENNIELKITDNSGKISKAYLVFAQDNRTGLGTEDAGYLNGKTKSALYLKANRFGSETTATETNPAIIKLTANIPNGSYTDGTGITRYVYAEDLAGNTNYDNVGAAGDTGAPGRIRFVWKPQTFKYNAQAPTTPIVANTVPSATDLANAVKAANPTFSDKIDSVTLNGANVTVTYKDGSTDTLSATSVFNIKAVAPAVTPVKKLSNLTTSEKQAVEAAVRAANPDAATVVVGNDGSTTLTYSNGSTATLTSAQTVKAADANEIQAPTKTPVENPSNLTEDEKDKVKKAIEDANSGKVANVVVGNDGAATVTFNDGSVATLTPEKTVVEAQSKGIQAPATYTTVKDLTNLTDKEKEKVAEEVKKANPTATKVEVGADGTTTVTFPDGSTATLTSDKTIQVVENGEVPDPVELPLLIVTTWVDESGNELKPAVGQVSTTLDDTYQAPEHGEISGYVYVRTETNANNGTVVHIFRKVSVDNGGTQPQPQPQPNPGVPSDNVVVPTEKPQVKDPENLTPSEKEKIKEEVEKANPGKLVVVDEKGNVTVTDPRTGNSVTIPATQLVVKQQPNSVEQAKSTSTKAKRRLAATGLNSTESASLGFVALLAGIALAVRRRKDEE